MPNFDIFNNDAFTLISLTDAVNLLPHVPGQAGLVSDPTGRPLWQQRGITTTTLAVEERQGVLRLIPDQPRGASSTVQTETRRVIRNLRIPHIAVGDTVTADQVQDVRAFGSETDEEVVEQIVNERQTELTSSIDATIEHLRIGALQGIILDADGVSVIHNLFTEFNVTQPTEVAFNFAAAVVGDIRQNIQTIVRAIRDELGGVPFTGVHAFCGSTFFDELIKHAETREAYDRWREGEFLRMRTVRSDNFAFTFMFEGVMFEEYQGAVGAVNFVDADTAHFFPTGSPGVFVQRNAPADFMETVNTVGLPRYSKLARDPEFDRWVKVEVQSNPLPICLRPLTLRQARSGV